MSQAQELPTTIDETTAVTWPENPPAIQPEKAPVFDDVSANAPVEPPKPDGRHCQYTQLLNSCPAANLFVRDRDHGRTSSKA